MPLVSDDVEVLAGRLLEGAALPASAKIDALHIAVATVHGIDFLLTWNCKHIANAVTRPKIEASAEPLAMNRPLSVRRWN
jgi:hypothetical protein